MLDSLWRDTRHAARRLAVLTLVPTLPGMEHARSTRVVPAGRVLVLTAFAPAAVPALRAALVNPIAALRQE
jgi:hypothetical protein